MMMISMINSCSQLVKVLALQHSVVRFYLRVRQLLGKNFEQVLHDDHYV